MAQDTLAPWAEIVPGKGRMTVDELLALPDDGWMYELVQGMRFRMPHKGNEASMIGVRIAAAIGSFVDERNLGILTGANGVYNLTQDGGDFETALIPTAAFVSADRLPPRDSPEFARALRLAPDLVVEVVSPSQYRRADPPSRSEEDRPEMAAKARRYLAAGGRLLWMVWPKYQQVDIWRAGAADPAATLGASDTLDGENVLPGFTYPIARLFK
ncbi:MAG: Uma2 family endonuclease [Ktedonobacterales bacterium]